MDQKGMRGSLAYGANIAMGVRVFSVRSSAWGHISNEGPRRVFRYELKPQGQESRYAETDHRMETCFHAELFFVPEDESLMMPCPPTRWQDDVQVKPSQRMGGRLGGKAKPSKEALARHALAAEASLHARGW